MGLHCFLQHAIIYVLNVDESMVNSTMEKLSPVLNGNDAITLASYHNVRDELHTTVETKNLIQFSQIERVTFKPIFTAKSLHGFSKMALEMQLKPQYYADVTDINDLSTLVPYRVLESEQPEDKVIKTPLHYTYVLNSKELIDGISSGLYEDFDLFKSRLDKALVSKRIRRTVPVEIETTRIKDGNSVVSMADLAQYSLGSGEDKSTNVGLIVKDAFAEIHEAYADDVAKAEIEARQHARDLESAKAPAPVQTVDTEYDEPETDGDGLDEGYIDALSELNLKASDDDATKILEGLSLSDVSTVSAEKSKQAVGSVAYDAGSDEDIMDAVTNGLEEDEFKAPSTSDEINSAKILELLEAEDEEAEAKTSTTSTATESKVPKIHIDNDDVLELD